MPSDRSIAELTRSIRLGDGDALTWLYRSRVDRLLAHVRSRTRRDEGFCLDVVQETFLRVIRSLPTLESEAALDAWIFRTADRCAIDGLRRESRRRRRERSRAIEEEDDTASVHPAHDAPASLWPRLAALPAATMDLIEARYRFGWTLARIGERFGVAPGAADGRITRTIERLRKELDDDSA